MQPQDSYFMQRALQLAKRAAGWTNPNPLVGAVIVKNGQIIARGYHKRVGLPHAEIEALNAAKTGVNGGTLYVNLEPCTHYGMTPPCVAALIESGIKRVVCSTQDPNPKVNGLGLLELKKAGINVDLGIKEKEARVLNETFFTFHEKKRPFIAIKFAASLDGKIATKTGDSKWITNKKARAHARNLRGIYQAVLVGVNTILKDNPHLGTRSMPNRDPIRIVLDSQLRTPLSAQVLRDTNIIIATGTRAPKKKVEQLKSRGIIVIQFSGSKIPIKSLLKELCKREIVSILVEGGGKVLGSFVEERLVDKVYAYQAPIIIGGEGGVHVLGGKGVAKIRDALRLKDITHKKFGDNLLTTGYLPG